MSYPIFLVNEINIAKLPEDDVPESIWITIERLESAVDGNAERTGYTEDSLMDGTVKGGTHVTDMLPLCAR